MIVETGHYALVLALALAIINAVVPLIGHFARDQRLLNVAPSVAIQPAGRLMLSLGDTDQLVSCIGWR